MESKDNIRELLSKKVTNAEVNVRPELWTNISSQIGTTAVAATGLTVATKAIIGLTIAAATLTAGYLLFPDKEDQTTAQKEEVISTNQEFVDESVQEVSPIKKNENKVEVIKKEEIEPVKEEEIIEEKHPSIFPKVREEKTQEEKIIQLTEVKEEEKTIINTQETAPKNEVVEVKIDFPNVFTPNNDSRNDEYFIKINEEKFNDFSAVIFNSKGERVITFDSPDFKWNGVNEKNEVSEPGMYSCMIIGKTTDGRLVRTMKSFRLCLQSCGD